MIAATSTPLFSRCKRGVRRWPRDEGEQPASASVTPTASWRARADWAGSGSFPLLITYRQPRAGRRRSRRDYSDFPASVPSVCRVAATTTAAAMGQQQRSQKVVSGLVHVRPWRRYWLSGPVIPVGTLVPAGAGAVRLGFFAVFVGLLPVLLDVAPTEICLLVMQPSCPVVCLGRPAACLGGLVPFLLYVSVGSLLEPRRAAHLVTRITLRGPCAAAYPIAVLVLSPRPCLSFLNLLDGLAGTVTGPTRPPVYLCRASEAPHGSLVVVASARWNRHNDEHRTTFRSGEHWPHRKGDRAMRALVAVPGRAGGVVRQDERILSPRPGGAGLLGAGAGDEAFLEAATC